LKILIVSTPRTGNTWLQHLLAAAYDLPMVDFVRPQTWEEVDREYSESGWVGKYHWRPQSETFQWALGRNVVLVTMVRHPADVLVSLYHYVNNLAERVAIDPEAVRFLFSSSKRRSNLAAIPWTEGLEGYVRTKFFFSLNFSIGWLQSGLSYGVRYEDLWHCPISTLRALTDHIRPLPLRTIEEAVERCKIETLRHDAGEGGIFFRSGGVGNWKSSLPASIVELFWKVPPYPLQFKWLGYDLSIGDVVAGIDTSACAEVNTSSRWLHERGLASNSLIEKIYRDFRATNQHCCASYLDVSTFNQFYSWLNASADDDPDCGAMIPMITNVAAWLYRARADLQKKFPDLYGCDRAAFSHWFVEYALLDHPELDWMFVARVCESWLQGPAPKFAPVHVPGKERAFWRSPIEPMAGISANVWLIPWFGGLLDFDPTAFLSQLCSLIPGGLG
jgi:sulfotransferase family protein